MPQPHDQMPFRLYREAEIHRPGEGSDVRIRLIDPIPSLEQARGFRTATVIINDHGYLYHYFHFMEMLLALWTAEQTFLTQGAIRRILFATPHWTNPRQHHIQRGLMTLLYPNVRIDTPSSCPPERLENVLLIDRNLAVTAINKFLEPLQWIAGRSTSSLVDTVFRALGVAARTPAMARKDGPCALYVRRPPPRCLSEAAERDLLARLPEFGLRVDVVDYAALPWEAQITTTAGYDAVIGVHGNGLTNLLWLPPHGGVLEFFPTGVHHYDYQMLAELKQLAYVGAEGKTGGLVYRDHSRHGNAIGHGPENNDREVGEVPWLAVAQFASLLRARLGLSAASPGQGGAHTGLVLL
ncbi:glycosyltransferase family 61 protein (plasmid) [Azospirillum sp. TSA2s]|uniref:glycosyltransferase 61 family protein n=1 Tax=Azospirillum sp. TSA2s TaxID=709810 RepID=UPI0010AA146C|nr:glycosyltransferase 61 family protein [Azospirillum sp. TSA2s]QCG93018.1 glycosyltransferase family 61 protein [Azospirillum sp. TSA2s]